MITMETPTSTSGEPGTGEVLKRLAHRVFVIVENRFQLLLIEAQEERDRFMKAMWIGLAAAVFALLAGITLTAIVAVAFWDHYPVIALLALMAVYAIAGLAFYVRLTRLQRDWQTLSATLEQLRKDRECLEKRMG